MKTKTTEDTSARGIAASILAEWRNPAPRKIGLVTVNGETKLVPCEADGTIRVCADDLRRTFGVSRDARRSRARDPRSEAGVSATVCPTPPPRFPGVRRQPCAGGCRRLVSAVEIAGPTARAQAGPVTCPVCSLEGGPIRLALNPLPRRRTPDVVCGPARRQPSRERHEQEA